MLSENLRNFQVVWLQSRDKIIIFKFLASRIIASQSDKVTAPPAQ
jgi:hypothetical protein